MVEAFSIEPAPRRTDDGFRSAASAMAPDADPSADPAGEMAIVVADHVCDRIAQQIETGRRLRAEPQRRVRPVSARERVAAAEALVLTTLPKRIDEGLLAASLGIDRQALRDAFLEVRGRSLYRAILLLRLLAVLRTLERHPDLTPALVAQGCGFASYGRFKMDHRAAFGFDAAPAGDPRRRARASRDV